MSYSGYSQFLCKNGHHWTEDSCMLMYKNLEENKCSICKEPAVWEKMVNTTNGSFDEDGNRIDGFIELKIKSQRSGICSECGARHICETTYEVPKK